MESYVVKQKLINTIEQIKTVHSARCGGLSDLYSLNGPELTKWIKQEDTLSIIEESSDNTIKASHNVLSTWLHGLHNNLLHVNRWNPADIDKWRGMVNNIQTNWKLKHKHHHFHNCTCLHIQLNLLNDIVFLVHLVKLKLSQLTINLTHYFINNILTCVIIQMSAYADHWLM